MRTQILTGVALLPLLFNIAEAAQSWAVDPAPQPFGYSSEESNTSSYLGVDITDVTTERLEVLKLKEEQGVEVTLVDQDAPAGKAGLKVHDVILTMNGTAIESGAQLRRMIHETPAGRIVTFGVSRDGQPLTMKVQLAERNKSMAYAPKANEFNFNMPPMPNLPDFDMPVSVVVVHSSARSGLMLENITPQLGDFFGVKGGNGILIRSVEKGSRAEKAGFRAGDVIVRVNDQPVHDANDFTHELRSHNGGAINVGVVRDKKEQNLTLPLPERKESGEEREESLDLPDFDVETSLQISQVQDQLAKLQPQIEFAADQLLHSSSEVRKTLCTRQKVIQRQMKKLQEDVGKQVEDKIKIQFEQLRQEVRPNGLEL
jgi:serine protease Do